MERSTEIEELVEAWFKAASNGDPSLVAAHVSQADATRLIGSDPAEVFNGGAAVSEFLTGEVLGAGGHATFTPADTEAFREGSVGWATTHVTIAMPDGRHVSPRWSAVFHQEDGVWKFVQTHASIAVPNDEIGWIYADRPGP
jgi:ketosteroid isomerase-like protein